MHQFTLDSIGKVSSILFTRLLVLSIRLNFQIAFGEELDTLHKTGYADLVNC
jgi:hypothetical protein